MTTYPHRIHVGRPHVNLWLAAAVVFAAAFAGLGAWVLVDRYAGGSTATQDATTLIDKINVAYSTGDANAIATLYASDAVIKTLGQTYTGTAAIRNLADGSFTAERIAPVTVDGEFATTFVKLAAPGTGSTGTTISVFQIKDGMVIRQWNFQAGVTPPFDNAVVSSF